MILDRAGIFKAVPKVWSVQKSQHSEAIAVAIQFAVTAQLNSLNQWDSWEDYEEHTVWGHFYVVKKDGTINNVTVEQLAVSLGWMGDLRKVAGAPPEVEVQINVKSDEYEGKVRYKVAWINPGDYTPNAPGESDEDVARLQTRFGSLLRAAASSAVKANGGTPPKPAPPAPAKAAATTEPDDDLPF